MLPKDETATDEETEKLISRAIASLSFIFGQKPSEMIYVLEEAGNFDELIMFSLACKEIDIPIKEFYSIVKQENKEHEESLKKVIQLWKKEEVISVANVVTG